MPEFIQNDQEPFKTVYVHFESRKDVEAFAALVGQTITMNTRALWYPESEILSKLDKRYIQEGAPLEERVGPRQTNGAPGEIIGKPTSPPEARRVETPAKVDFDSWSSLPPLRR